MAAANLYDILGVGRDADAAQIKIAHRKAARAMHPDQATSEDDKKIRSAAFVNIQMAYEILSRADLRVRYDACVSPEELLGRRPGREPEPDAAPTPLDAMLQAADRIGQTAVAECNALAKEVTESFVRESEAFAQEAVQEGFSRLRQRFFGRRSPPTSPPGSLVKSGR